VNQRTKAGWIPGVLILIVSMVLYGAFMRAGLEPLTFFPEWHHPLQFHVWWLLTLPVLGASAAYWSQRAGGSRRTRISAATLPVVSLMGFALLAFVADLIVDVGGGRHSVWHTLCGLGYFLLCWILAPGTAFLVGALPFLRHHLSG
jgi:hypothetical protein